MKKIDEVYRKKISKVLIKAEKDLEKIALECLENSDQKNLPAEVIKTRWNKSVEPITDTLDAARKSAGLSAAEFARLFGMPYRTMQNYLSGKNIPPVWVARLMLQKLSDFCEGKIEMPEAPSVYTGYLRKNPHQIEENIFPMIEYFETFVNRISNAGDSTEIFEIYLSFLKKFFPKKAELLFSILEE